MRLIAGFGAVFAMRQMLRERKAEVFSRTRLKAPSARRCNSDGLPSRAKRSLTMSAISGSSHSTFVLYVECLEERLVPSNAQYVNALYNDFLHRAPSQSEVSLWTSAIRA